MIFFFFSSVFCCQNPREGLKRLSLMWNNILWLDVERRTPPVFLKVVHQWERRQISGAVLSRGIGCLTERFGLWCTSMDCATHSHAGIVTFSFFPNRPFPNVIQILAFAFTLFSSPCRSYVQQLLESRMQLLFLFSYCSLAVTSPWSVGRRDTTVY